MVEESTRHCMWGYREKTKFKAKKKKNETAKKNKRPVDLAPIICLLQFHLAMADEQFSVPVNITTTDGQVVPVLLPPAAVAHTLPGQNSSSNQFDGSMVSLDLDAINNDPIGLQEPQFASEVMPTFGT